MIESGIFFRGGGAIWVEMFFDDGVGNLFCNLLDQLVLWNFQPIFEMKKVCTNRC